MMHPAQHPRGEARHQGVVLGAHDDGDAGHAAFLTRAIAQPFDEQSREAAMERRIVVQQL